MENSRTGNVIRNFSWAFLLQFILMILQFVARTVFIRKLGKDYLGITGLFADIIWILDIANMRIPDAIILCMYKPLSDKNNEKVLALLYLFRKACFIISVIILTLGLIVLPLLPYIIKDPPNIPENLSIVFLFFLFQAVVTYFVVYRRTIIFADQKNYIVTIYNKIFHFIQISLQIIVLLVIRNFYLFILIQVFCSLSMNFMLSNKAGKMYPFINNKNTYKLNKEEFSEIFTNIKSMFIYGLGSATLIGIDSILVSSIVGIGILGLCSNYMLIISSVKALIDQAMTGFTASIGNLNANKDNETIENTFNQVNFIVFIINAFFSINLAFSLSPLISNWLGNDFIVSKMIVLSLTLRFYIQGTQYTSFTFRSTLGLMKKMWYIPLWTAVVNIALSIVMGRFFGVSGIFFASSIAIFFFTIIPEIILLYKLIFKKSSIYFILRYLGFLLFMICNYFITVNILDKINISGWMGFIIRAISGAIISGLLILIVFYRDKNFKAIIYRFIKLRKR